MRAVTVTEAKAHLSRLLAQVRQGESILLLYRGRPVARLEPIRGPGKGGMARFQHLIRKGVLKRGTGHAHEGLLADAPPEAPAGSGLLEALLREREAGR